MASHGPGAAPGAGGGAGLYDVLGLAPDATDEAIRSAITTQRRAWRRRTASPEIEVRHEAERRMKLLDDAERLLLDTASRRTYDEQIRQAPAPTQPTAAGENWLVRAVQQMEAGHHEVATFTARQAVEADPENPYAWQVLANAATGAGDHAAAINAIERAISLDTENASLHFRRGEIFLAAEDHARALTAFRSANALAPDNVLFHEGVVKALRAQGKFEAAVNQAVEFYQASPDSGEARTILAQALADRATAAHHELSDGTLVISSMAQATHIESLANRGLSVEAPDHLVNDELRRHKARSRAARRRRLSMSRLRRRYRVPAATGVFTAALMCCLPPYVSQTAASATTVTLAVVVALAASGVALFFTCFEPAYERYARLIENTVPRRKARGPRDPDPK